MKPMKYLFIVIVIVSTGSHILAQESKDMVIGGSVSVSTNKQETNSLSFATTPGVEQTSTNDRFTSYIDSYIGKQINPKSIIGFGLQAIYSLSKYSRTTGTVVDYNRTNSTSLGMQIFYRHNLLPEKKINLFIQPSLEFRTSFGKIEQTAPAIDETKSNQYEAKINLGASYSFTPKWNLLVQIVGLSYTYSRSRRASQEFAETIGNFYANTRLNNLRIGLERKF